MDSMILALTSKLPLSSNKCVHSRVTRDHNRDSTLAGLNFFDQHIFVELYNILPSTNLKSDLA